MKRILLFVAVFASYAGIAQDLESKIPNSAEVVVSINGNRLMELVSISEFDNYNFAKKIFGKLSKKADSTFTISSIEDLGFDINSKAFYFYKKTDSINYHNFLIKLSDKNKFESLMSPRKKESIVSEGGIQMISDNYTTALWDNNLLLFSTNQTEYEFFKKHQERFESKAEYEGMSYYKVKKLLASHWTKNFAFKTFKGQEKTSVLNNPSYKASQDKNAIASVWVRNYSQLLGTYMQQMSRLINLEESLSPESSLNGFESGVANLYFDQESIRLTTKMEVNSNLKTVFRKLYKSKLDKNFYNYFNQNDALAYMSVSMDTKALLEEYPTLISSMYGGMMPGYAEEMDLMGELLSLALDEEAIGEFITGDMLLVLNDFGEKEVTYTTYKYDEDFEKKEVTKTKKEMVPDFMLMIGSKKEKLLNKLARLGTKHKVFENTSGYYKLDISKKDFPVDLYAAVKNNILFLTTSKENLSNVVNNRFVNNIGKHKKLLHGSNSVLYLNGEKLISKVPASELSKKEGRYFDYLRENFKDAYFKSSKIKGNKVCSELKINTSNAHGNTLKMLFNFIELMNGKRR